MNHYYNVTGETTVLDADLTIRTAHEIVNTTVYDVARAAYKKFCRLHDHVVFITRDTDIPGWSTTAVGGTNPHIVLEEERVT